MCSVLFATQVWYCFRRIIWYSNGPIQSLWTNHFLGQDRWRKIKKAEILEPKSSCHLGQTIKVYFVGVYFEKKKYFNGVFTSLKMVKLAVYFHLQNILGVPFGACQWQYLKTHVWTGIKRGTPLGLRHLKFLHLKVFNY